MFPNFSTFHLLFHQTQSDNNSNFLQLNDSSSPQSSNYENCSIATLSEFPKKKKKPTNFCLYIFAIALPHSSKFGKSL